MEEIPNTVRSLSLNRNEFNSMAGQSLAKSNQRILKSAHYITREANSVQTMTENGNDFTNTPSLNTKIEMISESLGGLYKKLEEIGHDNTTRFRKLVEKNKDTDKRLNEEESKRIKQEESTKIELQGMRRRFESFEKKKI